MPLRLPKPAEAPPFQRKKRTSLVVSTHLKNMSQIGSSPQVGVKIKNLWNHHLGTSVVEAKEVNHRNPWHGQKVPAKRQPCVVFFLFFLFFLLLLLLLSLLFLFLLFRVLLLKVLLLKVLLVMLVLVLVVARTCLHPPPFDSVLFREHVGTSLLVNTICFSVMQCSCDWFSIHLVQWSPAPSKCWYLHVLDKNSWEEI